MDIKQMVSSEWLLTQDVLDSPTKTVVIIDAGTLEDRKDSNGKVFKTLVLNVELDAVKKKWSLNKFSQKFLAKVYGTETSAWVGKVVKLRTMLMQGGKEGVVPVQ